MAPNLNQSFCPSIPLPKKGNYDSKEAFKKEEKRVKNENERLKKLWDEEQKKKNTQGLSSVFRLLPGQKFRH